MQTTVKMAISLPKTQFRLVERRRRRLHVSRSAVVREALIQWFRSCEEQEAIRQYLEGYQQHPETTEDWATIETMQAEAIGEALGHETW